MAGVSLSVEFRDRELRAALAQMPGRARQALAPIGGALIKNTRDRMRGERGPDGHAWAKLLPAYAAIKRGPGILRAGQQLFGSFRSEVGADEVRMGTNRIYARIHQFGGTIVPKKGRFLRFRLAGGIVNASKVKIPARPYLGIDAQDEQEIGDALAAVLGFK